MLKDLRLISRDHAGLIALLVVPIVVITVVASATHSANTTRSIVLPVVNEDQGPVATALISALRDHLDGRAVSRTTAHHMVAELNDAPAALLLPPELSKHYLAQKPSTVELLTDPAQWQELEAIKVVMLLADQETASLGDPLSRELLEVHERSITGDHLSFSSLEQNIPGFSLMFVLLTLIFTVALALREEEVWHTSARLSTSPLTSVSILGGKLLARLIVGTAQLLLLLLFGHLVYGLRLGHSPVALIVVATAVVAAMTCFAAVVGSLVRTQEQAIPVGLAVSFHAGFAGWIILATLQPAPIDANDRSRADDHLVDVRHPGRDTPGAELHRGVNRTARARWIWSGLFPYRSAAVPLQL
jgi:ABC-2 type transport system permease protein